MSAKRASRGFRSRHPEAEAPPGAWYDDARGASWTAPRGVERRYAPASFLAGNRVAFDTGGNEYRPDAGANDAFGVVYVRSVGTHAEDDRIDAGTV